MYSEQWGMCPICGNSKKSRMEHGANKQNALCVDHCHKNNKVRSLLCDKCNALLGMANDNISILQNATDYIKYFNKKFLMGV